MLAHQSLGDLRDCPSDIDPDAVVASINENCALKVAYKVHDPDTADWLARMSGKILIDEEVRSVATKPTFVETKNGDRVLRQTERCLVDTNMLQSLPSRCATLYGNGLADFIFTSPIKVVKQDRYIAPSVFTQPHPAAPSGRVEDRSFGEELLDVD